MDPHALIDTTVNAGLPAPFWLIQALKISGFTLHALAMNLWYAGVLVAMILHLAGGLHGRRFSVRLMLQMPIVIALGINFGIVPLLFTQVAYSRFFYPATILMAWFWFSIILLLIVAYYGVYAYAFGLHDGEKTMRPWKRLIGWLSAASFLTIGFLFTNGMSLMANVRDWPSLWSSTSSGGAALGTALNVGDPSFWPRLLLMFGLAITTTAAWVAFDAGWFAGNESEDYRRWAPSFAFRLYTLGMIWFAAAGAWYVSTWPTEIRQHMLGWPMMLHTLSTGAAPGLPWLILLLAWRRGEPAGSRLAWLAGATQLGVIAINAATRQIKQNLQLREFLDVASQPLDVQWSPIIVFLGLVVVGVALVAWMVTQVVGVPEESKI